MPHYISKACTFGVPCYNCPISKNFSVMPSICICPHVFSINVSHSYQMQHDEWAEQGTWSKKNPGFIPNSCTDSLLDCGKVAQLSQLQKLYCEKRIILSLNCTTCLNRYCGEQCFTGKEVDGMIKELFAFFIIYDSITILTHLYKIHQDPSATNYFNQKCVHVLSTICPSLLAHSFSGNKRKLYSENCN